MSLFSESPAHREDPGLAKALWESSIRTSGKWVEKHLSNALLLEDRSSIHQYAFSLIPRQGLLLEFGVYRGDSINTFAKALKAKGDSRTIYGFDSFEGLEEDWVGHAVQKGFFDLAGIIPEVESNVSLIRTC